jgi:hypothetical protein
MGRIIGESGDVFDEATGRWVGAIDLHGREQLVLALSEDGDTLQGLYNPDNTPAAAIGGGSSSTTNIYNTTNVYNTGNSLVSGGGVVATGNLGVTVSAGVALIQGAQVNAPQTDLTLDAADATNPRIDVIALNSDGTYTVETGTPAATPAKPVLDPASQLEITSISVPATATAIVVTTENIYTENAEWTSTSSGTGWTLASTTDPFAGTKCILGVAIAQNAYVNLADSGNNDLASYNNLVLYIKSTGAWNAASSLGLRFLDANGVQVGAIVTVKDGTFGFVSSATSSYQQIVIPASLFQAGGLAARQLRIVKQGTGTIGFKLDNIFLQGGVAVTATSQPMIWRGAYSANVAYQKNDVVSYAGALYVGIAEGTGKTPSTETAFWQVAQTAGGTSGKHAIYIAAGSMRPSATGGCAGLTAIASAANQPDIVTLDFDATTQEYAQFSLAMPKSWNEGTVTFVPIWSHPAAAAFGVVWGLQGVAVGNDDAIAAAYGTAVTSTDTGGTTNDVYAGPESAAITIAGTPAAEDVVFFRLSRVTGDGGDTMAVDARLHGIVLFITTNADTDA